MLPETTENGFRRTAVKKRDLGEVKKRADEYKDRGYETEILEQGGYHHLYIKKDMDSIKENSHGEESR